MLTEDFPVAFDFVKVMKSPKEAVLKFGPQWEMYIFLCILLLYANSTLSTPAFSQYPEAYNKWG